MIFKDKRKNDNDKKDDELPGKLLTADISYLIITGIMLLLVLLFCFISLIDETADDKNYSQYIENDNFIFEVYDKELNNNNYYLILDDMNLKVDENTYNNIDKNDKITVSINRIYDNNNSLMCIEIKNVKKYDGDENVENGK